MKNYLIILIIPFLWGNKTNLQQYKLYEIMYYDGSIGQVTDQRYLISSSDSGWFEDQDFLSYQIFCNVDDTLIVSQSNYECIKTRLAKLDDKIIASEMNYNGQVLINAVEFEGYIYKKKCESSLKSKGSIKGETVNLACISSLNFTTFKPVKVDAKDVEVAKEFIMSTFK